MTTKMQDGFWLGVDVGKFSGEACVAPCDARTSEWAKLRVASFTHDKDGMRALEKWLAASTGQGPCLGVCIESTGVYSQRFVHAIEELGLPEVSMVNPALPVAFRKSLALRDKCDRVDAAVLALYGVVHRSEPNTGRNPMYAQLRTLYRAYEQYDEDVQRFENRLEQCMDKTVCKEFRKTIAHLKHYREKIWKKMEELIAAHEPLHRDVTLLCTIPGVGEKTAVLVLAQFGDLRKWGRGQIVSYAGLYPKVYSSGTSVNRKPRLAKGGGSRIRRGLYMPAIGQLKTKSPVAIWARELIARGKTKMAAIGAIMRKQLQLMRGVLVSGVPYSHEYEKLPISH